MSWNVVAAKSVLILELAKNNVRNKNSTIWS